MSVGLAAIVEDLLGPDLPVAFRAYDGSRAGPEDASATLVIRSPDAIRRILTARGELGFARAYVTGDLDVEGDIFAALALRDRLPVVRLRPRQWLQVARFAGPGAIRPLPPPPEEARLRGRRHTPARDAAAVSHHYDVSNEFYRLILGPSMTYSCAVFERPDATLEEAQTAKHDLVCRKLGLGPGMRLLDIGCGWGGMVLHAARHYGVRAIGVTLSRRQLQWAEKAVAEAGLTGLVEVRLQDYRTVGDAAFDAVSSIGMFEHVGLAKVSEYFGAIQQLLRPQGRLLNHAISRPPFERAKIARGSFIERYVFPDGELLEVGQTVSAVQQAGFEARHLESLREHYALTLRAWVANLETNWDAVVNEAGAGRARIWRLYMAASALNFEANRSQVHQVLAVRTEDGVSRMPLRADWA